MSERREWTAERTKHVRTLYEKAVPAWQGGAFGLMASVAVSHLPDALREIERQREQVEALRGEMDLVRSTLRLERAEIERLKADLLLLGALKSAEVAPVIERFREAFGADVPQAPSGQRTLTFERAIQIGEKVHGLYPSEAAAVLLAEFGEPAKVDPPVRHARHDRRCLIHDGVGCSREPGCEVEE
jgi:hypothetical protein